MPAYGLTTTANTAKTARATVTRWNDKVNRHTLYTVCGTGADGWGLYSDPGTPEKRAQSLALAKAVSGDNSLTLPANGTVLPNWGVSFDTAVGRGVNQAKFNWVPISYPAAGLGTVSYNVSQATSLENNWNPDNLSIADSVEIGVAELVRQIKNTPGTFAMVGMSQGAIVISQVLRSLLTGGSLAARNKDCIGAVALGNPCRKPGIPYKGMTDPGEGGMFAYVTGAPNLVGLNNVALPAWWLDLAVPGDFFACAPVTGAANAICTALASAIGQVRGQNSQQQTLLTILASAFLSGAVPVLGEFLKAASSAIFKTGNENGINIVKNFLAGQQAFGQRNPHALYGTNKPATLPTGIAGLNSNSTYVDVAIAFLNARATAVAPR